MARRCNRRSGFTLVEVAMAVLVMAILAGAMIPHLSASEEDAKDSVLRQNLQLLRKQIQYFRAQHKGKAPGFGTNSVVVHLVAYTNANGHVALFPNATHPYGPYFSGSNLPYNPFSDGVAFKTSTNPQGETPDHDLTAVGMPVAWFYNPTTGEVAANAEGTTADGTPRISL